MNKSLKAKNLPLFSIIDLDQLRRENHLEGTEVTDFFTARDGKVYLLMEQPSETQGKDWLSIPSTYTAVEIQLDWAEQRVLETTLFPLGLLKFQFHYLRPAGEHFLLLGARCAYRENGPDQNAWIVSRDGAVLSRFCLGDGIQDCVVKKDGTIITSYFDEGVFGNYGWDEPLGDCGLIAWTSDGTPLWKNEKYSIYDCYAISLDEEENLWFYYYDEFRLVRTNFKEDFVFELPIEGSGAFSVAPSGNTFLFQGGYQQRDKFYFLTAHGDRLGQKQEAIRILFRSLWDKIKKIPVCCLFNTGIAFLEKAKELTHNDCKLILRALCQSTCFQNGINEFLIFFAGLIILCVFYYGKIDFPSIHIRADAKSCCYKCPVKFPAYFSVFISDSL